MPPDSRSDPQPTPSNIPCPICGKAARADYRPFCSKRCADVDLNRWLGGVYAIPSAGPDEDEDGDAAPQEREP